MDMTAARPQTVYRAGITRTIPAARFFTGMWSTALAEDELLTSVTFPVWRGRCGFAIEEFARRSGDFAIAGAVVAVGLGADGRIDRCAIGLFGLGPAVSRATGALHVGHASTLTTRLRALRSPRRPGRSDRVRARPSAPPGTRR